MKVSFEIRKAILKAKQEGVAIKDICSKFDLSKATIHRVLQNTDNLKQKSDLPESSQEVKIPLYESKSLEFSKIIEGNVIVQTEEPLTKKDKVNDEKAKELIDNLMKDVEEETVELPIKHRKAHFAEPLTQEDLDTHNILEQKIILNIQNFAPLFRHIIQDRDEFLKSLHSKSNDELQGILTTLETTRTTVNLSNQMKQMFFMTSKGVEVIGSMYFKLKTDGLTENFINQQQELDMIFREMAIEYAPMFKMTTRPELRLAMCFTMTLLQTDSLNRIKDSFDNKKSSNDEKPTPENKFSDL